MCFISAQNKWERQRLSDNESKGRGFGKIMINEDYEKFKEQEKGKLNVEACGQNRN